MRSTPRGLAYFDAITGKSVWIEEVRSCQGELQEEKEVIWLDALDKVRASIRYRVQRDQFEQDIILLEQLPSPDDIGLTDASDASNVRSHVYLETWTEFQEAPDPRKTDREPNASLLLDADPMTQPPSMDEHLGFGTMQMGNGRIYLLDNTKGEVLPILTTKRWIQPPDKRCFLIESVSYESIIPFFRFVRCCS